MSVGAALACLGVILGAFAAHALRSQLSPDMLEIFKTGVHYHQITALAIFAAALGSDRFDSRRGSIALALLLIGVAIFSGSLYALSISGVKWLGMITPIGGVAMILGYGYLAWAAALKVKSE